jgi:hypothetical protein
MKIEDVKKVNETPEAIEMTFDEIISDEDKQFEDDVMVDWKVLSHNMLKKYGNSMTPEYIRLKTLKIITTHIGDRLIESLKAKDRKIEKLTRIKEIIKEKE